MKGIVLLLCIQSTWLIAQNQAPLKQEIPALFGASVSDGYSDLFEMPRPRMEERKGSPYFNADWNQAIVSIKGKEYRIQETRFNILDNYLEIKWKDQIKVLDGHKMDYFLLEAPENDQVFVKAAKYKFNGSAMTGFLELIHEKGEIVLFKKHKVTIKPPDFNEALQMGNKFEEIVMKQEYYIANGIELWIIEDKKNLVNPFADKSELIKIYIRGSRINYKNEADLKELIDYYVSLRTP